MVHADKKIAGVFRKATTLNRPAGSTEFAASTQCQSATVGRLGSNNAVRGLQPIGFKQNHRQNFDRTYVPSGQQEDTSVPGLKHHLKSAC
jgi:hypothetical protein